MTHNHYVKMSHLVWGIYCLYQMSCLSNALLKMSFNLRHDAVQPEQNASHMMAKTVLRLQKSQILFCLGILLYLPILVFRGLVIKANRG